MTANMHNLPVMTANMRILPVVTTNMQNSPVMTANSEICMLMKWINKIIDTCHIKATVVIVQSEMDQ